MQSFLRTVFTPWVVVGAFVFALLLSLVFILALWTTRPEAPSLSASTAVMNVIRVPTSTPTPTPAVVEATETPSPEEPLEETGTIVIGAVVEVSGTGGTGLRVRLGPGLGQGVRFLADESEEFVIQDGPIELDGYTWWNLASPTSEDRAGWAVEDYLRVKQSP
jgi:hypothetical protein